MDGDGSDVDGKISGIGGIRSVAGTEVSIWQFRPMKPRGHTHLKYVNRQTHEDLNVCFRCKRRSIVKQWVALYVRLEWSSRRSWEGYIVLWEIGNELINLCSATRLDAYVHDNEMRKCNDVMVDLDSQWTTLPEVPVFLGHANAGCVIFTSIWVLVTVGELLVAKISRPSRLASALPWFVASAVYAAWVRYALGTIRPCPSYATSASSRTSTTTVFTAATRRTDRWVKIT